jgi:hypothetical protein
MTDFPADVEGLVERLTAMAAEFQKVRPQIGSDGPTEALLREAAARLTALARQVERLGSLQAQAPSVPTEGHDAGVVELAFIDGATAGILSTVIDEDSEAMTARIAAQAKEYAAGYEGAKRRSGPEQKPAETGG